MEGPTWFLAVALPALQNPTLEADTWNIQDTTRALDFAIAEHEKNRMAQQATERFIKSGIEIQDVCDTQVG
jgi:hypothetical protein